jgi:hypothetical protein
MPSSSTHQNQTKSILKWGNLPGPGIAVGPRQLPGSPAASPVQVARVPCCDIPRPESSPQAKRSLKLAKKTRLRVNDKLVIQWASPKAEHDPHLQ